MQYWVNITFNNTHSDVNWIEIEKVLLIGHSGRKQDSERRIRYWRGSPISEKVEDVKDAEWGY